MTPTEIIATRLFGWAPDGPCQCGLSGCKAKEYTGPHGSRVAVEQGRAFDLKPCSKHYWPDLTDYNWIRKMEDALLHKGLFEAPPSKPSYVREIRRVVASDASDYHIATFATAAQRVEAAIKVLEEQG